MTDYSKKFRFVHAKEKRVERDRVGEIRGEKIRGRERVDLSFNLVL